MAITDGLEYVSHPVIYDSYAGTDIVAELVLPGEKLTLGELQTISYSMHRNNSPLRVPGHVNPIGFVKGGRCIPATEKVLVQGKGYISIADVILGDYVQSSGFTFDKVLGSYDQGVKRCFQLKAENGYSLKASYDHPISTPDGWVELRHLRKGDKIHVAGFAPSPEVDLAIADDVLKLVGFLIGDGSTHIYPKKNGSKEYRVSLSIANTEMETVGTETAAILARLSIPYRDVLRDGCVDRVISVCLEGFAKTDWGQRKYNDLHFWLLRLGLYGRYSHNKFIPQEFLGGLSKRQVVLFLRYLFTTDGWYAISGENDCYIEAGYGSTSEELVDGIRILLSKAGIDSIRSFKVKKGEAGGRPSIISRHDYHGLTISRSLTLLKFIRRIGIFGKDEKIKEHIPTIRSRIKRNPLDVSARDFFGLAQKIIEQKGLSNRSFKRFNIFNYNIPIGPTRALRLAKALNDDFFTNYVNELLDQLIESDSDMLMMRVSSVKEIGDLPVYDLEVENRHAFICNHVRVHNTLAGSLIFTTFNQYAFYRLRCFKANVDQGLCPVADMLPPFDVALTMSNESGSLSKMKIYGITIIDEGGTMSVDDLICEQTFTFMARGIEPMRTFSIEQERVPAQAARTRTHILRFN